MNPETAEPPLRSRLPDKRYEGRNGFYEDLVVHSEVDQDPTDDELKRHHTALYTLTQKDSPIPTLQQMKAELDKPDDLPDIAEQINNARDQHLSDLQRLYAFQAEEYLNEAFDRYLSKDDLQYLAEGENNPVALEVYEKLDNLYNDTHKLAGPSSEWEDQIALMRYTHFQRLGPLYVKKKTLEAQREKQIAAAEEERKRQEAQFPISVEDFHTKPRDVQDRAARFLALTESAKQEKMLSEFGWAWRQVKPLLDEYSKNPEFQADILALVIEMDVKDPRKRAI